MSDRKQFQNVPPPDPELMRLLEASRRGGLKESTIRSLNLAAMQLEGMYVFDCADAERHLDAAVTQIEMAIDALMAIEALIKETK